MRRAFKKFIVSTAVIAALLMAGGVYSFYQFTSPGPLAQAKTLVFPKGSGLQSIGEALKKEGVIPSKYVFEAAALALGEHKRFKAGEYAFTALMTPQDVMRMLTEGKTVVRRLTVAEGVRVEEVRALLMQETALSGALPSVIPEGSLLPETYHFSYGDSRAELVDRMQRALRDVLAEQWPVRKEGLPLASPREALILASIVEKETGVASERAHVAAVYINRLKQGMKLQADPTALYAVELQNGPLHRPLSLGDLKRELPYNTYFITGLPPGPIANPGRASIVAALHPADAQDIYFVATGDGGHRFAKTMQEHEANVRKYRQAQREKEDAK